MEDDLISLGEIPKGDFYRGNVFRGGEVKKTMARDIKGTLRKQVVTIRHRCLTFRGSFALLSNDVDTV